MTTSATNNNRVPPHSYEAERAVLGAILIDNDALDVVAGELATDDFYREAHRHIFATMLRCAQERRRPIDVLTVGDAMLEAELHQAGGLAYLNSLLDAVPTSSNAAHYARIVRQKAVLRRVIGIAIEAAAAAYAEPDDADALAEYVARRIGDGAAPVGSAVRGMPEVVREVLDDLDAAQARGGALPGTTTGLDAMDAAVGGFVPGELVIVAARPGVGKTTLAVQTAAAAAVASARPALVVSLEMRDRAIVTRLLTAASGVRASLLRSGRLMPEEWASVTGAAATVAQIPVLFAPPEATTISRIRACARREHRARGGLACVVVDYLQLVRADRRHDKREGEVAEVARELKAIATELGVPVLAAAQLNREVERRGDARPVLADLRESGEIEQAADIVAMLYRAADDATVTELIVRKARNWSTGTVLLGWDRERVRFTAAPEGQAAPPPTGGGARRRRPGPAQPDYRARAAGETEE